MKRLIPCSLSLLLVVPVLAFGQAGSDTGALSSDTRQKLEAASTRAAAYLLAQARPDGALDDHPGVTAMAAAALLHQPGVPKAQTVKTLAKTLDSIRGLAKPDGGIYRRANEIPHYITAVSVMALTAAGQPSDKETLTKGRQYLAQHLLDEGEGVAPGDKFYGGLGYGGTSNGGIADVIGLEYGLRAIKEAGAADDDPAWNKALAFLQRTQNRSESNDQEWATNDGGFVYYPGYSQAGETLSYGAGSYAGLLSYTWANVKKTDPRVQSVLSWIRANYTVEENPGLGDKTLYYYYMVFAKALQAVDEPIIVDAAGQRHNWREDLGRKLLALQNAEGFWVNTHPAEMQTNKTLVTAFTMMAIQAILG